jgi:PAS domain S-box-containing protein
MFPKTTQFEMLLEAVPDALVGVDQKGVIRFVNHQTEVLFGYDCGQMTGEHITHWCPSLCGRSSASTGVITSLIQGLAPLGSSWS